MEIWLKQEKSRLRLPVLPEEVGAGGEQDNRTETVNALGEVNLLGLPKLKTFTLEAHFPADDVYYAQYSGYPSPKKCVKKIEKMKKGGVVRLIITPLVNCEATIESFEWKEKDGTGDIYYTIALKEYRRPTKKRSAKKVKDTAVTAKKGDTWAKLSKKYTGTSKNAEKIAKFNDMGKGDLIKIGKKVMIKL